MTYTETLDDTRIAFHVEQYSDWNPSTREHERCMGVYQTDECEWLFHCTLGEVKELLGRAFYNAARDLTAHHRVNDRPYYDRRKIRQGGETYYIEDFRIEKEQQ